jgi:hypothetical protein
MYNSTTRLLCDYGIFTLFQYRLHSKTGKVIQEKLDGSTGISIGG